MCSHMGGVVIALVTWFILWDLKEGLFFQVNSIEVLCHCHWSSGAVVIDQSKYDISHLGADSQWCNNWAASDSPLIVGESCEEVIPANPYCMDFARCSDLISGFRRHIMMEGHILGCCNCWWFLSCSLWSSSLQVDGSNRGVWLTSALLLQPRSLQLTERWLQQRCLTDTHSFVAASEPTAYRAMAPMEVLDRHLLFCYRLGGSSLQVDGSNGSAWPAPALWLWDALHAAGWLVASQSPKRIMDTLWRRGLCCYWLNFVILSRVPGLWLTCVDLFVSLLALFRRRLGIFGWRFERIFRNMEFWRVAFNILCLANQPMCSYCGSLLGSISMVWLVWASNMVLWV